MSFFAILFLTLLGGLVLSYVLRSPRIVPPPIPAPTSPPPTPHRKMSTAYQYSPLQGERDIRVLDLFPAPDRDDSLRFKLRVVTLGPEGNGGSVETAEYEALSYEWGAKVGTEPVWCDGKKILVTPNCESALKHLRQKDRKRTLWIDAICINQGDKGKEKSQQVRIMFEIYKRARRVLVWLGKGTKLTSDAFKHLMNPTTQPERALKFWGKSKRLDRGHNALNEETKAHLSDIIANSYFSRLWTIQEVAATRDVTILCGNASISWNKFFEGVLPFSSRTFRDRLDAQEVDEIEAPNEITEQSRSSSDHELCRVMLEEPEPKGLFGPWTARNMYVRQIVDTASTHHCRDEKDKVFALHGLCRQFGLHLPEPDYHKSTEVIYAQTVRAFIRYTESLDILTTVKPERRPANVPAWIAQLPSWVPDLLTSTREYKKVPQQSAALKSHVNTDLLTNGSELSLHLQGVKFGTIIGCGMGSLTDAELLPFKDDLEAEKGLYALRLARDWTRIVERKAHKRYPLTKETPHEALVRLMLVTAPELKSKRKALLSSLKAWSQILREVEMTQINARVREEFRPPGMDKATFEADPAAWVFLYLKLYRPKFMTDTEAFLNFTNLMTFQKEGQRLFVTDNGYLGLGPRGTQVGDQVAVLAGGKAPMVLRPKGAEFQFLGTSIVHDAMEGMIWLQAMDAKRPLQDFILV